MSQELDPKYMPKGQPHQYEEVSGFRRRNPYVLYEEQKTGLSIPPSDESELAREEDRVRAFEARTGEALIKRSEDAPATLPMPDTSWASRLGYFALGATVGVGIIAAISYWKPDWVVSLTKRLGIYNVLAQAIYDTPESIGAAEALKAAVLKSRGLIEFGSADQTGISFETPSFTFKNERA